MVLTVYAETTELFPKSFSNLRGQGANPVRITIMSADLHHL
jgi:hypothetical protein